MKLRLLAIHKTFCVMCVYVCYQIGCKILASLIHYTSCSTYFWMLCEGIYLHTLIIVAVFVGEQHLGWYYLLGWGEESSPRDSPESDSL